MPVNDYASFVLTVVLFLALPGPGNLAILSAYRWGGVRAAMVSTLGIALGDQVLIVLALSGLATILQEMPVLFKWLEYLGASYLIYLGWGLWRQEEQVHQGTSLLSMEKTFRQSVAVTLLNPKAIFFYMAFFPLFLDKDKPIDLWVWFVLAGSIAVLTLLYGVVLLLLIKRLSHSVKNKQAWSKHLARVLGVLFMVLGVRLACS